MDNKPKKIDNQVTVQRLKNLLPTVKNVQQALDFPNVSTMKNRFGEDVVIVMLFAEVEKGLEAFNVKAGMSSEQISVFVDDFLDEYNHESIADLKICLKRARLGKYGTHYQSIDQLQIMEWFKQYLAEKADARRKRHEKIKNKIKQQITGKGTITPEQFKELRKQLEDDTKNT